MKSLGIEKEKLPVLNFSRQYMNNTKISWVLSTKLISIAENHTRLNISINGTIINCVDVWRDENITLSSDNVTPYDMAVMDAAYTIICSGQTILTAEWIAKVLSGNPKQKVTQKKIEAIRQSIDKLRYIHIKIDCTEEFNARRDTKNRVKDCIYESYLLPIEKVTAIYEANGKMRL